MDTGYRTEPFIQHCELVGDLMQLPVGLLEVILEVSFKHGIQMWCLIETHPCTFCHSLGL